MQKTIGTIKVEDVAELVKTAVDAAFLELDNVNKGSKNPKELAKKIFIAQTKACHILAMCALNYEQSMKGDGDVWLDDQCDKMKIDLEEQRKLLEAGTIKLKPLGPDA